MALIIRSDETLTAPLAGTPVLLPRFDLSLTADMVGRWSARSLLAAGLDNGAPVSSWATYQGEAGIPLTQAGSNRPVLATAGIGGKPAVSFTEASDHSISGALPSQVDAPYTLAMVLKHNSTGLTANVLSGIDNTHYITLYHGTTGIYRVTNDTAGANFLTWNTVTPAAPQVLVIRVDGASSGMWISAATAKVTGTAPGSTAISLTGLAVGRNRNSATVTTFDGLVSEVVLYSAALSNGDIATLQNELGAHYGITIGA